MTVLYENDAFSVLVLSTKKRYSNFLKKVFVFQKTSFKVKVLKMFKISSNCHIKTCHFILTTLFVLTLASDMTVLYENDAFSVLVLSTKKRYSNFLKKVFVFQKTSFKVKVLKMFKISSNCHIKTCPSLKRRTILKIPSTVF